MEQQMAQAEQQQEQQEGEEVAGPFPIEQLQVTQCRLAPLSLRRGSDFLSALSQIHTFAPPHAGAGHPCCRHQETQGRWCEHRRQSRTRNKERAVCHQGSE